VDESSDGKCFLKLRSKLFSKFFGTGAAGKITRREFLNLSAGIAVSASLWPSVTDELDILQKTLNGYLKPEHGETLPFDFLFHGGTPPGVRDTRSGEKSIFLTFDDGPLLCTPGILDLLALRGQKATFFVIGRNLSHPNLREVAIRALREGHDIANHSYDHPDFSTISAKRATKEIVSTHALIEEVVDEAGVDPARQNRFFRFPYGAAGSRSNHAACLDILSELNYNIAWWNLDTNDWRMELAWFPRPASAVIKSLTAARPQDVVLLHDRTQTRKHLAAMLDVLQSRRLVSIPLSDCIIPDEDAPKTEQATRTAHAAATERRKTADDFLAELCEGLFPKKQVLVRPQRSIAPRPPRLHSTLW
jgi:peptidoglycan/xylan/chitin deacetylase (PgdA/CDA1 family)